MLDRLNTIECDSEQEVRDKVNEYHDKGYNVIIQPDQRTIKIYRSEENETSR